MNNKTDYQDTIIDKRCYLYSDVCFACSFLRSHQGAHGARVHYASRGQSLALIVHSLLRRISVNVSVGVSVGVRIFRSRCEERE